MSKELLHEIYNAALTGNYKAKGHFLIETHSINVTDAADMTALVHRYREIAAFPNKDGFMEFLNNKGIVAKIMEPDFTIETNILLNHVKW